MKNEQQEIKDVEISKQSKRKQMGKNYVVKWIGAVITILILVLGLQYFSFVKKAEARRVAQAEQEQLLVSHWQQQGFSDDEIQVDRKSVV